MSTCWMLTCCDALVSNASRPSPCTENGGVRVLCSDSTTILIQIRNSETRETGEGAKPATWERGSAYYNNNSQVRKDIQKQERISGKTTPWRNAG